MKNTAIAKVEVILPDDPRYRRQRLAAIAREIKARIEDHLQVLRDAWERGKPFAVKVGLLLIEAKKLVKAQKLDWIPWIEANCCDERAAQRYMRIAKHRDDPRLIEAERKGDTHGRALTIEGADRLLRRNRNRKTIPERADTQSPSPSVAGFTSGSPLREFAPASSSIPALAMGTLPSRSSRRLSSASRGTTGRTSLPTRRPLPAT
jgi:hypothetical protein